MDIILKPFKNSFVLCVNIDSDLYYSFWKEYSNKKEESHRIDCLNISVDWSKCSKFSVYFHEVDAEHCDIIIDFFTTWKEISYQIYNKIFTALNTRFYERAESIVFGWYNNHWTFIFAEDDIFVVWQAPSKSVYLTKEAELKYLYDTENISEEETMLKAFRGLNLLFPNTFLHFGSYIDALEKKLDFISSESIDWEISYKEEQIKEIEDILYEIKSFFS